MLQLQLNGQHSKLTDTSLNSAPRHKKEPRWPLFR